MENSSNRKLLLITLTTVFVISGFGEASSSADFPLLEFLQSAVKTTNISADPKFDLENAKRIYLCSGSSGCCDCNEGCFKLRTCCIDKLWNSTNPVSLSEYLTIFRQRVEKHVQQKCVPIQPFSELSRFYTTNYYMVNSCIGNTLDSESQKCSNDTLLNHLERFPVFGSDNNLYKNRYCARCNNINSYVTVNLTMKCEYRFKPTLPPRPAPPTFTPIPATLPPIPGPEHPPATSGSLHPMPGPIPTTSGSLPPLPRPPSTTSGSLPPLPGPPSTTPGPLLPRPGPLSTTSESLPPRPGPIPTTSESLPSRPGPPSTTSESLPPRPGPIPTTSKSLPPRPGPPSTTSGSLPSQPGPLPPNSGSLPSNTEPPPTSGSLPPVPGPPIQRSAPSTPGIPPPTITSPATTMPTYNVVDEFVLCRVSIENSLSLIVEERYTSECLPDNVHQETCNELEYSLCHLYKGIYGKHRNIHCHLCEGKPYNASNFPEDACLEGFISNPPFRWSLTISFSSDSTQVAVKEESKQGTSTVFPFCENGQVFNAITGSCETFTCAPGFRVDGVTCTKEFNLEASVSVSNPDFSRCLTARNATVYVLIKSDIIKFDLVNFTSAYENDFNTTNEQFIMLNNAMSTILQRKVQVTDSNVLRIESVLKNSSLEIWNFAEEIVISSQTIEQITQLYGFDLSRHSSNGSICASTFEIDSSEGAFGHTCEMNLNRNSSVSYSDVSMQMRFTQDAMTNKLSYCTSYHLTKHCPLVQLAGSNYTINPINKALTATVPHGNLSITPSNYLPTGTGIYICGVTGESHSRFVSTGWRKTLSDIELYISVILTIISIVCAITFLITSALFRTLRNRGGMMLLVMGITVLVSDILFVIAIFGGGVVWLCKTVAILLHWSLLLVAVWAIVLAVDLTYYFLNKNVGQGAEDRKSLVIYMVVSLFLVTVIVAVCIALNESNTVGFRYGEDEICWIGALNPRLATYLIPVVLGYVGCLMCLSCLLCFLRREEKVTRSTLKGSGRAQLSVTLIAIKLVAVLGIAEIIGFVQINKSSLSEDEEIVNATFALLFNVMRSVRGTVIFLLCVVNKKTWKHYKNFYLHGRRDFSRSQKTARSTDYTLTASPTPSRITNMERSPVPSRYSDMTTTPVPSRQAHIRRSPSPRRFTSSDSEMATSPVPAYQTNLTVPSIVITSS